MGFRYPFRHLVLLCVVWILFWEISYALGGVLFSFQQPTYLQESDTTLDDYHCDETKAECKINFNLETSFALPERASDFTCASDFDVGSTTGEEAKCNPNTVTFPVGLHTVRFSIVSKTNSGIHTERTIRVYNRYIENPPISSGSTSTGSSTEWSGSVEGGDGSGSSDQTGSTDTSSWSSQTLLWFVSSGSITNISSSGAFFSGILLQTGAEARIYFWTGDFVQSALLVSTGVFSFIDIIEQTHYIYRVEAFSGTVVLDFFTGSFTTSAVPLSAQALEYCDRDLDGKIESVSLVFNKAITGSLDVSKLLLYSETGGLSTNRIGTLSGFIQTGSIEWNTLHLLLVPQDLSKHTLHINSSTSSDLRLKMNEDIGIVDFFGQPMERLGLTTSFDGYAARNISSCSYDDSELSQSGESMSWSTPSESTGRSLLPLFAIKEINWAGTTQSTADEWIRFENISTGSLSLSGWTASGILGSSLFRFPSVILSSGSVFTISNYAHTDFTSDLVTTSLSLSNEHLDITLTDVDGKNGDSFIGTPCFSTQLGIMSRRYFSWSSCDAYEPILYVFNTGSSSSSGDVSTGSLDSQSGSESSSGHVATIHIQYTLQSPSNIFFLTGSEYGCTGDVCRMNIDLSSTFSGVSASDYTCSIMSDFSIPAEDMAKCNPPTMYIPGWAHSFYLRVISKSDSTKWWEKTLSVVHTLPISSVSAGGSSTSFSTETPVITVQSGLSWAVCSTFPCRVNVRYLPKNTHEYCRWDFGDGIFKQGTEHRCDPSVVIFPSGNHRIRLDVYDQGSSDIRHGELVFSSPIPTEKESLISKENSGSIFIAVANVNQGSFKTENRERTQVFCPFSSGCTVTLVPRTQSGILGHMLRYEWNAWSGVDSEAQKPRFFLASWSTIIHLRVTDYEWKTAESELSVTTMFRPEVAHIVFSGQLRISGVIPSPAWSDDFEVIEIINNGTGQVSLDGCSLDDRIGKGTSRAYRFASGTFLDPGATSRWYGIVTGIRLDNRWDEVNLLCDHHPIDTIAWDFEAPADYRLTHDDFGVDERVQIRSFSWSHFVFQSQWAVFSWRLFGVREIPSFSEFRPMRSYFSGEIVFETLSWFTNRRGYLRSSAGDAGAFFIQAWLLIPDGSSHRLSGLYLSALRHAQKSKAWAWSEKSRAKSLHSLLNEAQISNKSREEKRKRLKELESFFWNATLLSSKKSQLVRLFRDNAEAGYVLDSRMLSISGMTIPHTRVELSFSSSVALDYSRVALAGYVIPVSFRSSSAFSPEISLTNTQTRIYTTEADSEWDFFFSIPLSGSWKPVFSLVTLTHSGEAIPFDIVSFEDASKKLPSTLSSGTLSPQKIVTPKSCTTSIHYQPSKTYPASMLSGALICREKDGFCKLNFMASSSHAYCQYRWFLDARLIASTANPRAFNIGSGSHLLTLTAFPNNLKSGINNVRAIQNIIVISSNSWVITVPKNGSLVSGESLFSPASPLHQSPVIFLATFSLVMLSAGVFAQSRFLSR